MTQEDDLIHLRRAIALARATMERGDGPPFGAVVVKDGVAIAEAANTTLASGDLIEHAELMAIRHACRELGTVRLDGVTVYASGEPCPMCLGLMYQTGVSRYVFASSVEDARIIGSRSADTYADLKREPSQRSIRSAHVPLPEAVELLEAWRNRT